MRLRSQTRFFGGREDYLEALGGTEMALHRELEREIARLHRDQEVFGLSGLCSVDSSPVRFLVDRQWGALQDADGLWLPNWRERLECPICSLNCRQRVLASMALDEMEGRETRGESSSVLYVMEQVTPMFEVLASHLGEDRCLGSEFLGPEVGPGTVVDGIRHEDAENLSFGDGELSVVASNDVLEHVADPRAAVAQVARVLEPGGVFLFSVPFDPSLERTRVRAELVNGEVLHHDPPEYHGNPLSDDGSLVFSDFGWDLIEWFPDTGFSECRPSLTWDLAYGFLGAGSLVFRAVR